MSAADWIFLSGIVGIAIVIAVIHELTHYHHPGLTDWLERRRKKRKR